VSEARSEIRDGMRIDWDVPIKMDDGLVLRADAFHPVQDGRFPEAKWLEAHGIEHWTHFYTGFLHDDPRDRPAAIFGGKTTLHVGPDRPAYVLVPVVPPK
jgi:hypothetical protein